MDPSVAIVALNLEEISTGGKDSNDSVKGNSTTGVSVALGTNDEKNLIRVGDIDCKTRMKRHTEKENEISIGDQVRWETSGPPEGSSPLADSRQSSLSPEEDADCGPKRHLSAEPGTESFMASVLGSPRSPPKGPTGTPPLPPGVKCQMKKNPCGESATAFEDLRKQNQRLVEALLKTQKAHAVEKKRFNDTLMCVDKALSSLPIRLEKIRVRNQRNLHMITSSKLNSGDGNVTDHSIYETSSPSEESVLESSPDSDLYVSTRMRSLLQKMDQLNELVRKIHDGDSSPIELLLNSELYAISLLKREIRTTKKQIEENKTDTETSYDDNDAQKEMTEDSCTKAKNSFSNELNKASNFKIFENHMMLQEEALDLLTRKIKETEEALLKEVEAKEALKRENEAMAKEIFRLKSTGEESKGGKLLKTDKLKPEVEATGNRPYRLIKELKTKLEEKEKSLIAWKSKFSRTEAASANKTTLLELEKRKNTDLEKIVASQKSQIESLTAQQSSLQCINKQLIQQMDILQQQVEILATDKLEEFQSLPTKTGEQTNEGEKTVKMAKEKGKKIGKDAKNKIQEMKIHYEKKLKEVEHRLKAQKDKNEEFSHTFKELLIMIHNFVLGKDVKDISSPSYDRIREILHLTPSDLELLFSAYTKCSTDKEVERLYNEYQSIVEGEELEFSKKLSTWLFDIIIGKLLH